MAFIGFPPKVQYTPVPNPFFGSLLEEIDDIAELKCTLRVFWMLYQKKRHPRFISFNELLSDKTLSFALKGALEERENTIRRAMDHAVTRRTLIQITIDTNGEQDTVYLLNAESERRALATMESRKKTLDAAPRLQPWTSPVERPNIFTLYEENIGVLTPLIADKLKDAEERYPKEWIQSAFTEAVSRNIRKWSYISRILERWKQEGREYGEPGRYSEKIDPKEYLRRWRRNTSS